MKDKKNALNARVASLVLVGLMIMAAAFSVNKSAFGIRTDKSGSENETQVILGDSVSVLPDGGTVIHTQSMSGMISGYAGPVPLDIYIDSDGRINDVKALPNVETPSFFQRASALLKSWNGKTPEEGMKIDVDAVSGATYSSNAIINNVKAGLAAYQGTKTDNRGNIPVKIWIALAVTLAACVLPLLVKRRLYNNIQLLANVAVLGFWSGQFLDYSLILKYTSEGFNWPVGIIAILMLVAAFIYPLFGKAQYYCNHICPLGSAQILMAELCGYKIKMSPAVIKGLDWFRKILWAVLMLLLWADCLTGWMDLELFQAFQFQSSSLGITIAAGLFLLLSLIVSRPYCRFVCPTGSLFKRSENIG